jgi:cytochrome d ubiquinol oxidase subunit I
MRRGKLAVNALAAYQMAKEAGDEQSKEYALRTLRENYPHFGYGFIEKPSDIVPNVPLTFYAFHIMVILGGFFLLLFGLAIFLDRKGMLTRFKWFHLMAIISIPLVYICTQAGWIVAEVGRQPWTIQDLLTTNASLSGVSSSAVLTTTIMFFVLFSVLLAAELTIMFKVIKKGPAAQ